MLSPSLQSASVEGRNEPATAPEANASREMRHKLGQSLGKISSTRVDMDQKTMEHAASQKLGHFHWAVHSPAAHLWLPIPQSDQVDSMVSQLQGIGKESNSHLRARKD